MRNSIYKSLNTKIKSTNKSGYRLISWHKSNNKWVIQYKGKYIACAKTLEDVIMLRDEFLKKNNLNDVAEYWRFKYGSN